PRKQNVGIGKKVEDSSTFRLEAVVNGKVNTFGAYRPTRQQRNVKRTEVTCRDIGCWVSGGWNIGVIVRIEIDGSTVEPGVVVIDGVYTVLVEVCHHEAATRNEVIARLLDVIIINTKRQPLHLFWRIYDAKGYGLGLAGWDIRICNVIDVLLE